jgi:hypothetical protein
MQAGHCLNCGAPLAGPYCHACGQPVKGMIRHLKSILHDFLDTVFEYDSRIWRTIVPLYFRPGRVTRDYIAGKRVRFVLPFRLFFVLTVLTFFVFQLVAEPGTPGAPGAQSLQDIRTIRGATRIEEVEAVRVRTLEALDQTLAELGEGPGRAGAAAALEAAKVSIEREAARRIEWLETVEAAQREGRPPPAEPYPGPSITLGRGMEPWDPATNPVVIEWLPGFANDKLNEWIARAARNVERAQEDPGRFVDMLLGLLPAALFVLMPIFALLLKLFHPFTGRLYMEHMVVALHSHSFLALALMVSFGLSALAGAVPEALGLDRAVRYMFAVSVAWIPLYLLIMQRRVYAQGWPLTLLKFGAIGVIYTLLVSTAVTIAALVALVRG